MDVLIAAGAFAGADVLKTTEEIRRGILAACPNSRIRTVPLPSMIGSGAEAIAKSLGGEPVSAPGSGEIRYGYVEDLDLALLDLPDGCPDSRPIGEAMRSALKSGAQQMILLKSGAAPADCGRGLLEELGLAAEPEADDRMLDVMDPRLMRCDVKLLDMSCQDAPDRAKPDWLTRMEGSVCTLFGGPQEQGLSPFSEALQLAANVETLNGDDAFHVLWQLLALDETLERTDVVVLVSSQLSPFARAIAERAADYGALSLAVTGSEEARSSGISALFPCSDPSQLRAFSEQLFRLIRAAEEQQHPWPDLVF